MAMLRPMLLLLPLLLALSGLASATHDVRGTGECVRPGRCEPPPALHSRVLPVTPRQQWNTAGGFCGSMSIQTAHLAFGAWISQGLVRSANEGVHGAGHCDGGTPGHPGPDKGEGCEVGALNLGPTVANLKLDYDLWDYNSTKPQAPRYKAWMKKHLVQGHAIVWLVMCKGDDACPYPGACPNGGAFGHVEPVWGIYSNHSLDDPTVYPDDFIVHSSDQDLNPYYRPFHTLQDTPAMEGNCKIAQAGFGRNEMYPCINVSANVSSVIIHPCLRQRLQPLHITLRAHRRKRQTTAWQSRESRAAATFLSPLLSCALPPLSVVIPKTALTPVFC
jgi:hypothetical protein